MKKTLTEQYRLIKEDKGHKGVFLKEAKKQFPNLIRQGATYNEASTILKQKNIISENFVGTPMVGNPLERKKEGFENAFENFLKEAAEVKAEEKKVSKEVEEDQSRGYDTADKKDPNNMIFGQIQMGYYCEYKDPKNEGKTDQELLEIVYKNLAKDPIFYTKNGQFGEKDLGYTDEAPSLGEPVEPKGEYKSSGYGKLKEHKRRRRKLIKEEKYSGAIIRKGTSSKAKKDTKIVRQALKDKGIKFTNRGEFGMDFKDADLAQIRKVISGLKVGEFIVAHDEDKSKKPVNEIAIAGGIVTGTGFVGMDYREYYGLDEADGDADRSKETLDNTKEIEKLTKSISTINMFEEDDTTPDSDAPEHMEAVADAVEMAYEAGMSTAEIIEFVEMHLGLKMGDY